MRNGHGGVDGASPGSDLVEGIYNAIEKINPCPNINITRNKTCNEIVFFRHI